MTNAEICTKSVIWVNPVSPCQTQWQHNPRAYWLLRAQRLGSPAGKKKRNTWKKSIFIYAMHNSYKLSLKGGDTFCISFTSLFHIWTLLLLAIEGQQRSLMLQSMCSGVWGGRGEWRASSLILCHGKTSLGCFRRESEVLSSRRDSGADQLRGDYVNGTQSVGKLVYLI